MQDIKIKNYKRLILSVFIGASLISIMQVTILQVLLTCCKQQAKTYNFRHFISNTFRQ